MVGGSLALCGGAMQGLLRNPLADGSTLGVSSAASLGAVIAIAFGISIPGAIFASTTIMASIFAFVSMVLIFALAKKLDNTLATNTIILIGVVFSMFAGSIISFIVSFSSEKLRSITFWTMGSLAGSTYANALVLFCFLLTFGALLLFSSRELNAFALSEDNARHIGVNVRKVKLIILLSSSFLIAVCVAIGGNIAFVGLIVPHIARLIFGPNHKKLLIGCVFIGSCFLMLADLAARTILSPKELPIGILTSFVGSITFILLFWRSRRVKHND
jgi:iron complex transport system permease protein